MDRLTRRINTAPNGAWDDGLLMLHSPQQLRLLRKSRRYPVQDCDWRQWRWSCLKIMKGCLPRI